MTTKTCTKCGETKSADQFYKNRTRKNGVKPRCKTCSDAQHRAYYETNRDKINARRRAYREENRDKINAQSRAYGKAHREEQSAYSRAYRERNRAKINDSQRARYALVGNPSTKRSQEVTARYATRTREPWTPEEDQYIITGPGTYADKALQLSRTYNAVDNRAAKLRRQDNAA